MGKASLKHQMAMSLAYATGLRISGIRSIDDVIDDVGELGVNDEWSGGGSQTPGQQRLEVVG